MSGRTVAGTGEDHRVHVGGAQRFVRGLAHRPAQRLDQVGFAAAVRADHAGQAGFDHAVSGFHKRLETMEAKTREFHGHDSLLAGRESLCRDNTMEGNVGVRDEQPLAARMAGTMARPGPKGNRRARLFPAFSQGLSQDFCGTYESL